MGGRTGGAVAGAVLSPLTRLSNDSISNRIVDAGRKESNMASNEYKDIFSKAPKDEIVIPEGNIDFSKIRKGIKSTEREPFDEYLMNPTIENAHKAQSIIGEQIRNLDKMATKSGGLNTAQTQKFNRLKDARDEINKSLSKSLGNQSGRYKSQSESYAKNVVPYKNKNIEKYKKDEIFAKQLVDRLSKDSKFMKSIPGSKHSKELKIKSFINMLFNKDAAKFATGGAVTALGLNEGKDRYDRYNNE